MERKNTSPCNTKQFLEGFSEHPPAAAASPSAFKFFDDFFDSFFITSLDCFIHIFF